MNIDDLKDAWNQDEPKGMQLTLSEAMLGKTTSAVQRIRKNMKSEFIGVLISYFFLTALLFYGDQSAHYLSLTNAVVNITMLVIFILFILNAYYFFKFFLFYRSFTNYDLNLKNSIRKMAYELELNTEIYKTYNFCVTPLAVLVTFMLLCGKNGLHYMQQLLSINTFNSPFNLLITFSVILISFIVTYICVNFHIKSQYGKYLAELKQVVDDLGSEG